MAARDLFFLSHFQQNSQDQCFALSLGLLALKPPARNWYDMSAKSGGLDARGMKAGVESAAHFILYLNDGTLTRPWVQMEVRRALELGKPITLVYEPLAVHGARLLPDGSFDFEATLKDQAPPDLHAIYAGWEQGCSCPPPLFPFPYSFLSPSSLSTLSLTPCFTLPIGP